MVAQVSECYGESEIGDHVGDNLREFPALERSNNSLHKCTSKLELNSETTMANLDNVQSSKEKKKKKFKPGNNLWCFSIKDDRYDHDESDEIQSESKDYIAIAPSHVKPMSTLICLDDDCELVAEVYTYTARKNNQPKSHKQMKDIQFNSKRVKQAKMCKKQLMVKSDIYSRKVQRGESILDQMQAKKSNIEERLRKNKLERRGVKKVTFAPKPQTQSNNHGNCVRLKGRWSHERKEERRFTWEVYPFALVEGELQTDDKSDPESQLMWTLIQLQHRELTPEDYDILLQLDEKVAAQTVDEDKLRSLKTRTLCESDLNGVFEDPCSVCMDGYIVEQTVKYLPCNHVFHELCIDNWLTNSGNKCPLDGLQVEL